MVLFQASDLKPLWVPNLLRKSCCALGQTSQEVHGRASPALGAMWAQAPAAWGKHRGLRKGWGVQGQPMVPPAAHGRRINGVSNAHGHLRTHLCRHTGMVGVCLGCSPADAVCMLLAPR